MGLITNRRSIMNLFSDPLDPHCHQVRIVMAEKGVSVEIIDIDQNDVPEELMEYNPYGELPTLVDRDLVIFTAPIILEYLDERFPHPPLMPVYPVARAQTRGYIYRIERDLYPLMHKILQKDERADEARAALKDSLIAMTPVLAEKPYFLSDEFSLIDCTLAPLLWRLPAMGIELPPQAKAIEKYAARLFKRDAFQASLSETEHELR